MRPWRLAAPVVLAVGLLGAGCGALPLPCDIIIAGVPPDTEVDVGDPLPANVTVVAGPGDFDPDKTTIARDATGSGSVELVLRGDAIERVGVYTTVHTGELLAFAVNGIVVSIPTIQSALLDGRIELTSGALDRAELAAGFAPCVR